MKKKNNELKTFEALVFHKGEKKRLRIKAGNAIEAKLKYASMGAELRSIIYQTK